MKRSHLICDKTEIIVTVLMGNRYRNVPLNRDKIKRIQFEPCKAKAFPFRSIDSEKIVIEASGAPGPVVLEREKEKDFFDQYKAKLRDFAKNNHLTFVDNTKS